MESAKPLGRLGVMGLSLLLTSTLGGPARAEQGPKRMHTKEEIAATFKVAVLELTLKNFSDADKAAIDRGQLAQDMRNLANDLVPGLSVLTANDVDMLLQANNIDPEKCEGLCAVDIGRKVNADFVIDGSIAKRANGEYRLDLHVWAMQDGAQKKGIAPTARTNAELEELIKRKGPELLDPVKRVIDQKLEDERALMSEAEKAEEARLAAEAKAKEEARAKERQAQLDREQARAQARQDALQAKEDAKPRHAILRKVGWVTMGVGVVGGLFAGYAAIQGKTIESKLGNSNSYVNQSDQVNASNQIPTLNTVARVGAIVSGAVLLTGLTVVLWNQDAEESQAQTQLAVSPNGLVLAGRF
ncbi:MAG: hypothetical protein JST92_23555 [Deltaproteobacteria bacterium]|nr:hypothetical protein [Deltaproteobacteria bacterium]